MIASFKCTIEQVQESNFKIRIAYWLTLIHSTCNSSLWPQIWFTRTKKPTTLSCYKNVIFIGSIETEQRYL